LREKEHLTVTAMTESPGAIKLYANHRSSVSTATICTVHRINVKKKFEGIENETEV